MLGRQVHRLALAQQDRTGLALKQRLASGTAYLFVFAHLIMSGYILVFTLNHNNQTHSYLQIDSWFDSFIFITRPAIF